MDHVGVNCYAHAGLDLVSLAPYGRPPSLGWTGKEGTSNGIDKALYWYGVWMCYKLGVRDGSC
jgi:hypothetical protein